MIKQIFVSAIWAALLGGSLWAGDGAGTIKLGYIYLDETGNQSVNHGTFNEYEGAALSLDKFRYTFNNGMQSRLDLKRISLNNRDLRGSLTKHGLFGLEITNNQYRRFYDFDGNTFARRAQTGAALWFKPNKYVTVSGGGNGIGYRGETADHFDPVIPAAPTKVDYDQVSYNGGIRFNKNGRMFQARYEHADFSDNYNSARDQSRFAVKLDGYFPVPNYENRLILSAGFRRFESEFKTSSFGMRSNMVWGAALANLPYNLSVKYSFLFDRTASDSDYVATDNIINAGYVTYTWPARAAITVGYQHNINDDYFDEVKANSYYVSGWWKPAARFELRGEHGMRSEEVKAGSRLTGDQDFGRFRLSVKYRGEEVKFAKISYEGTRRENDQIGSDIDFNRFGLDLSAALKGYADLSGGYSYSAGEYENGEENFEFRDHVIYCDLTAREYYNFTAGLGGTYYRSQRDLDVESFVLRFSGNYKLGSGYYIEARYNIHNFDDFLVRDRYYTANIVEINISKDISL